MGYKIKADSSSVFGTNQKIIEEECLRKEMEYHNNEDFAEISQQCEREKVRLKIQICSKTKFIRNTFYLVIIMFNLMAKGFSLMSFFFRLNSI